jgi:hypothetical protein
LEWVWFASERIVVTEQRQVGFHDVKFDKAGISSRDGGRLFPGIWSKKLGIGLWAKAETVR